MRCLSTLLLFLLLSFLVLQSKGDDGTIVGVLSSVYVNEFYPGYIFENVDMTSQLSVQKTSANTLIASSVFSSFQEMFTFPPWPLVSSLSIWNVYSESTPTRIIKDLDDGGFCNYIADSIYSKKNDLFVLSCSEGYYNTTCLQTWNVYSVARDGNVRFIMNSPFDDLSAQPLKWMAYNEDSDVFVFYYPTDEQEGYFISQQKDSGNLETDVFPYLFISIDWLEDDSIIGPCVTGDNFGICVGNYTSGEVIQVIHLTPSYSFKLSSTYLEREDNLYTFAGQSNPSDSSKIEIYLVDITNYQILSTYSYNIGSNYVLTGLYIYPSSDIVSHPPSSPSPFINLPTENDDDESSAPLLSKTSRRIFAFCVIGLSVTAIGLGIALSVAYFYMYNKFKL